MAHPYSKITSSITQTLCEVRGGQTEGAIPVEGIDTRYWEEYGRVLARRMVIGRVEYFSTPQVPHT